MNIGKNRQGITAAAALAFGALVLAVPKAAARAVYEYFHAPRGEGAAQD